MIKMEKSSLYFGSRIMKKIRKKIVRTSMITSKESFGKYLGIQADFGQSKKTVFAEVCERIEMPMAGWVEQLL